MKARKTTYVPAHLMYQMDQDSQTGCTIAACLFLLVIIVTIACVLIKAIKLL